MIYDGIESPVSGFGMGAPTPIAREMRESQIGLAPIFANNSGTIQVNNGVNSVARFHLSEGIVSKLLMRLVPREGLEPSPSFEERILSPQRLPFRHPGMLSVRLMYQASAVF